MRLKKIVALLLATTVVLGMTACGGSQSTSNKKNNNDNDKKGIDWTLGADDSQGDITLKMSLINESERALFTEFAKRFHEKYDWINIEFDIVGNESVYYSNLTADLISGTAPDVFVSHTGAKMLEFVENGYVAPQNDFEYMENYNDTAKATTVIEGVNYAYLDSYNYFGFLYNKDQFAKAGVSVPKNTSEFYDVVDKLTKAGFGKVMVAGKTWTTQFGRAILMCEIGTKGYKEFREGIDNGSITDITTFPGVMSAINTMQGMVDHDVFYAGYEGTENGAAMTLFTQGKTPIVFSGAFMFADKEHYFPGINAGFFPLPTETGTGISYAECGHAKLINAASKYPGAAKLWVEFLATPEQNEYYCKDRQTMSTIQGVNPDFESKADITANVTECAIVPVENLKHEEYWTQRFNTLFKGIIFDAKSRAEDLLRIFKSQLEDVDLANL